MPASADCQDRAHGVPTTPRERLGRDLGFVSPGTTHLLARYGADSNSELQSQLAACQDASFGLERPCRAAGRQHGGPWAAGVDS